MALVMKCDRCGKYFDYDGNSSNAVKIIRYKNTAKSSFNYMNEFDLCPDCMDAVYRCLESSGEELLAKCRSNKPITRNDVGITQSASKDGTVYLKENGCSKHD